MGRRTPTGPPGRAPADKTFARILATHDVDRIVSEAANRLESGRRLYVQESLGTARAELELLTGERKRISDEGGEDVEARVARLDRLIAAVEVDLATTNAVRAEIENAPTPQKGGWTVIGRVLNQDGTVPKRTEVIFVSEDEEASKLLGTLTVGGDGMVRRAYDANVVKGLAARRVRVAAAARIGARIVAQAQRAVPVRPQHVYQFDLRIDVTIEG